ncbi:trans-resveratrol di-O-methyltransferase-like [Cornus florida]|uniref:trans-resveratrol di-O-methyltransferase-like n=1 Tax=Cornus florida TaxID=4283 RepID=UPI00289C92F3|nr:trans-resveratrol di-O-methyltransferase-like [Cornus florida]
MAMTNDELDKELLHSQAHIWHHIFNFMKSMSLKCAVQLGIADIIHQHGQPMTLSELVAVLKINKAKTWSVYHLMRILVHSGFLVKQKVSENDEEDGYLLTPASRRLLKDKPLSVRPFLLAMLDPIFTEPWHYVSQWFHNDNPTPFDTAHGKTILEYVTHEPKLNNLFNDAMASDSRLVASVVIKDCKVVFEGLNSIVDVGGGTGTVAKAIADGFPHLHCTVIDLPHVVAGLQGTNNFNYVGGNMFEAIPPADAALLKWVLHDWSDEESVKILKKCKEAIPSKDKGGKVIIIDMVVKDEKGDDESMETQLLFDMLMMVVATGRERNEKEWAKLFFDAGFSDYKITPILGLRPLIEVYP